MKELGDSALSEKGKDAKVIFDFISKTSKEDLEKIRILAETEKTIEEKDAKAIFDFISKFSKEDLEKIANTMEKAGSMQKEGVIIPVEGLELKKLEEKIKKMREMELIDISEDEFEKIKNALEQVGRLRSLNYNFVPTKEETEKLEQIRIILAVAVQLSKQELKEPFITEVPSNKLKFIANVSDSNEGHDKTSTINNLEARIKTIEKEQLVTRLYREGIDFINRSAYKEAYECFDQITEINQNLKGAWLNKGVALDRLGGLDKIEKEIECYETALWIDEKYDKALRNKEIAGIKLEDLRS
jgi:tetratricopeptide (TPR) repeat protein